MLRAPSPFGRAKPGWRGEVVTFSSASHPSLTIGLRAKREPGLELLNDSDLPVSGWHPSDGPDFIRRRVVVNFVLPAGPDLFRWPQGAAGEGSIQALGLFPDDLAGVRSLLADSCVIHNGEG